MILTILGVIAFPLGLWMIKKDKHDGIMCYGWLFLGILGAYMTVVMAILIMVAHIGVDTVIEENRIEYEALCERQEIVESEYEDVSKSDVIKDISEWNKKVYHYKYWANNPWTSWCYSKRIADDMKMIDSKPKGAEHDS